MIIDNGKLLSGIKNLRICYRGNGGRDIRTPGGGGLNGNGSRFGKNGGGKRDLMGIDMLGGKGGRNGGPDGLKGGPARSIPGGGGGPTGPPGSLFTDIRFEKFTGGRGLNINGPPSDGGGGAFIGT